MTLHTPERFPGTPTLPWGVPDQILRTTALGNWFSTLRCVRITGDLKLMNQIYLYIDKAPLDES